MANRKVSLKFLSNLAKRASIDTLSLAVDDDFQSGVASIRREVEERLGDNVLYTLVYNGSCISLVNPTGSRIRHNDEFKVVPVVLGG